MAQITDEVDRVKRLLPLLDEPEKFLKLQNELLYDRDLSIFRIDTPTQNNGLPVDTNNFYTREAMPQPHLIDELPRILNIGSGAEESRKLTAVNTDLSDVGKPEVVCDARKLPFPDNYFTVVRASHILEHIAQDEILGTLKEWRRVLHPQGELHIAVPDAMIAFDEIVDGKTKKGDDAVRFDKTTAPLAQIYGLGYENPETDLRWRHTIIFSFELLKDFLLKAGFEVVNKREKTDDLAYMCGVRDDSQNRYTLLVTARNKKLSQAAQTILSDKLFRQYVDQRIGNKTVPKCSFIIPIYNEAKNLPHFLSLLEHSQNVVRNDREFIFVLNGCTDNSEEIVTNFIKNTHLTCRLVESDKGINRAVETGIANRHYDGYVGKIDADTFLHPQAIDLMHTELLANPEVRVTYAEPYPLNSMTPYNEVEHTPPSRSKRLYYHGRTCLFRSNPLVVLKDAKLPKTLKAEDVFLSYLYAYYYGLDSISLAPHALVYGRTVTSLDDLRLQHSRLAEELEALHVIFPPFKLLDSLLEREVFIDSYANLVKAAKQVKIELNGDWQQITGTK